MQKNDENENCQIWKINDQKANKDGPHSKIYWVKNQKKFENGSNHRSQWKFSHCYQGSWENNIKSGFGIQFYENGDKYEGEWANNCRNGFGTYWIKNDKKKLARSYAGQYINDQKHGKGTMFFENGNRYDGHWEKNAITGFGRMLYTNGDTYIGYWFENQRNGYGVFTKSNGDYYEGNWLLDKREGYGSHLFISNQKIIVGEWSNDMPKTSILYKLDDDENNQKEIIGNSTFLKTMIQKKNFIPDTNDVNIRLNNMVLPVLQLNDPIEVLESAFKEVRKERLGFRIYHSSVESLVDELELNNLAELFRSFLKNEQNVKMEEVSDCFLDVSSENLQKMLIELHVDSDEVYFEDFVKMAVYRDNMKDLA